MTHNYLNNDKSIESTFSFAWGKIKKLYPLHIITMLLSVRYALYMNGDMAKTGFDIGIHTLLLQPWIPNKQFYATLNTPSWYLSACFFLYLCFPIVYKLIKNHMTVKRGYIGLAMLFLIQILLGVCAFLWSSDNSEWFSTKWIVYFFPPVRLIDFVQGCLVGYLYLQKKEQLCLKIKKKVAYVLELIVCLLIGLTLFIITMDYEFLQLSAFKYTVIFVPTTITLILLVFSGNGFLSKILSIKPLTKLGDISPYVFLVHDVVLMYACLFFSLLLKVDKPLIVAIIAFVGTVIASLIWSTINKYVTIKLSKLKK